MSTTNRNTGRGGLVSLALRRILSPRGMALSLACLAMISLGASPQVPLGSTPNQGFPVGGAQAAVQPIPIVIPGGGGPHRPAPTDAYFSHFGFLNDGDYGDALKAFKNDLSSGIKSSESRWIDSICYYTMVGECYYHLGEFRDALDNYDAALRLYIAFPNWMMQLQFPGQVQLAQLAPTPPWGHSTRGAKPCKIPVYISIAQGSLYANQQMAQGGVIAPPVYFQIGAQEIVRCMALSMRRRFELMGPVCQHDKMSADILHALSGRPGPANKWADTWIDLELGMAYLDAGETGQAIALLKRSLLLGGEYDHPLTDMALLTLGQIALASNDYSSASNLFEEATYAAVQFPMPGGPADMGVLEEAFRYGELTHIMAGRPSVFPPLTAATMHWAHGRGRELEASLQLSLAECQSLLERPDLALGALDDAKKTIARRDMMKHEIGSRMNYLTALAHYQKGNIKLGDEFITESLNYQRSGAFGRNEPGSKWLFQIWLADAYVLGKFGPPLGAHRALGLYDLLLRDPTALDWSANPLESLAVLTAPHPLVYEHWFETTLQSGVDLSLEVADRAKRHRFLCTLPLGGRLTALRWVLESPLETLSPAVQLERQNLLVKYPDYERYAKQVRKLRDELKEAPLAPEAVDAQRKQADKLAEIAQLSSQQELLLRQIALRHEASDLVFPPVRSTREVQNGLPPRTLMLIFYATSHSTFACLLSKEQYALWKIESPQAVERRTAELLRAIGNYDANHEIPEKDLTDESWRLKARTLTEALLAGSKVNLAENIDELIVIPDGMLWYLPFETLAIPKAKNDKKETVSLIARSRIRYLPTMGLALPDARARKPLSDMGVVLGKLHPKSDPAAVQAEFAQFQKVMPHAVAIKGLPAGGTTASPLYGSLFDGLVVLDDLAIANEKGEKSGKGAEKNGHYDWSPMPLDRVKGTGALGEWFSLPWKSPTEMILPGFHTPAESALKQLTSSSGNDMFLSVCGLMSTGSRTLLLSRWRTGGETTYDLVRQFTQELPYSTADEAWQRSVQLIEDQPLDLSREPRVKVSGDGASVTGKSPFFWAGYMLVDTGWAPAKAEPAAPPPIIIPPKPRSNPLAAQPAGDANPAGR